MNLLEIEDHVRLIRSRAFAVVAKHEVNRDSGVEWRLVRPPTRGWVVFLLGVLFVAGCAWAAKEGNWTELGGLVLVVMGLVLMRKMGMREHPAVEVIAKLSDDGEKMTFPLAGIEWPIEALRQLALRDVFLKRSSYSGLRGPWDIAAASGFNDNGRLWVCVYVFGEDEQKLIFAQPWNLGNTGMEKAVRAFCDAAGMPLMEPDAKRHGPSAISI
jgi:hypothetical protein